jgi:glycerol-3-phosphate dehydrogenase (NAD(P)+)
VLILTVTHYFIRKWGKGNAALFNKVAVIGSGSWGTALANLFSDAGCEVFLWGKDSQNLETMAKTRKNAHYLVDIPIGRNVVPTVSLELALQKAELIVCSTPAQYIREVFKPVAALLKNKPILNTSKGIETHSCARMSEVFHSIAPESPYLILSGPSFAEEVAKRLPTAVTIASHNEALTKGLQGLLRTPYFRSYRTKDVMGVELGGALKNVVAIASGIVSGLKLGHNALAAIINRGLVEIARMGEAMGAEPKTFLGLAGMGDLVLTCTGPLSRNRKLGQLLGEGQSLAEIQKTLGGVAEGVFTTKSAYVLAKKTKVDSRFLQKPTEFSMKENPRFKQCKR